MGTSGGAGEGPGVIRIEALRYRSLRYVSQELGSFQVLVGPNASGKSNFLDVVAFLGDLLRTDLETAILGDERLGIPLRATDARHLTWMRRANSFELAVEIAIPKEVRSRLKNSDHTVCRYEVKVDVSDAPRLIAETLWLKPADVIRQRSMCRTPRGSSWRRCGSSPRKATRNRPTDRNALRSRGG